MIAPFQSRLRMAWPFAEEGTLSEIDTAATNPPWSVVGDYRVPPPEVCDLLTAKQYSMNFEFSSAAFNDHYGEDFPVDISFPGSPYTGTWIYNTDLGTSQTYNEAYKWDSQIKLFQREIDPEEDAFAVFGLAGITYIRHFRNETEEGVPISDWVFTARMSAAIPYPAKNQDDELIWRASGMVFVTLDKTEYFSLTEGGPTVTTFTYYTLTEAGSTYLGIDDLGGPGQGEGGCLPVADVAIISHFDP